MNIANNLQKLALVMCYHITTAKTVEESDGSIQPRRLPWDELVAVLVFLTIAELAVRFNSVPNPPVVPGIPLNATATFDWISGICAGLATALLAERLDSRFIRLSPFIVTLLYGYAVIQAAWPTFGDNPNTRIVIVNIALALKILLFAIIYWLFRSGVLLYYLDRVAAVNEHAPTEEKDFLTRLQRNIR